VVQEVLAGQEVPAGQELPLLEVLVQLQTTHSSLRWKHIAKINQHQMVGRAKACFCISGKCKSHARGSLKMGCLYIARFLSDAQ
jgi:hypothetical protein